MAWKKVILSGSAAELASLSLDTALTVPNGGTGLSSLVDANRVLVSTNSTSFSTAPASGSGAFVRFIGVDGVSMSGSFSGSFEGFFSGDGSGLTGLPTSSGNLNIKSDDSALGSITLSTETLTFTTASAAHGFSFQVAGNDLRLKTPQALASASSPIFANLNANTSTFNLTNTTATTINFGGAATTITVGNASGVVNFSGRVNTTGTVTGSGLRLTSPGTGVDNTVLILTSGGNVRTDEIDGRVWGNTLVDGSGSANRVAFWSTDSTIVSNSNFSYNGTLLTVGNSTFGTNTVISGDLTVLGNTFNQNVTNLYIEDRFVLLNSGSATGDGGIVVQTETNFNGSMFGWNDVTGRWALQTNVSPTTGSINPHAYISAVVDVDNGQSDTPVYQKNGNIKIESGEIYVYVN